MFDAARFFEWIRLPLASSEQQALQNLKQCHRQLIHLTPFRCAYLQTCWSISYACIEANRVTIPHRYSYESVYLYDIVKCTEQRCYHVVMMVSNYRSHRDWFVSRLGSHQLLSCLVSKSLSLNAICFHWHRALSRRRPCQLTCSVDVGNNVRLVTLTLIRTITFTTG